MKRGIPYTINEARMVAENQLSDIYHKELFLWLCDEIDKLHNKGYTAKVTGGKNETTV